MNKIQTKNKVFLKEMNIMMIVTEIKNTKKGMLYILESICSTFHSKAFRDQIETGADRRKRKIYNIIGSPRHHSP
ncbi:hypothetical protein JMN32_05195 [Fulvivirga sp. 29W222]|uniref:Uncharacterized protein n=1 Tax=Fulvivirga marina TaxID=2494733 RepID=A0A937FVE2_9BACT|nr:hypothetical protein [Fulvivirga marina]MBL6445693.1 hypothetical protein [Fulvivirga marina]